MIRPHIRSTDWFCVFGRRIDALDKDFLTESVIAYTSQSTRRIRDYHYYSNLMNSHDIAVICKKGIKLQYTNQDDFFILKTPEYALYGIFDGHGQHGHLISNFVQKLLPYLILSDVEFETNIHSAMTRAFSQTQELIEITSGHIVGGFNAKLSGTTAVIVLVRGESITVGHVGDSRAIVTKKSGKNVIGVSLTQDHKPEMPEERARIEQAGASVKLLEGDVCHRVFAPGVKLPGLSMSRALGDIKAIDPDDLLVILASDGVWEFISTQKCASISGRHGPKESAASCEVWLAEEGIVDDITCICASL
ncbi:uncharacterized protein LOC142598081 [Dermatophagoides farinae]|uniref:uncharacterized protein LOC142598081 n=1 Tax=Dermatophagoides farinae TaxID=6954 RepID=UPI003F5E1026